MTKNRPWQQRNCDHWETYQSPGSQECSKSINHPGKGSFTNWKTAHWQLSPSARRSTEEHFCPLITQFQLVQLHPSLYLQTARFKEELNVICRKKKRKKKKEDTRQQISVWQWLAASCSVKTREVRGPNPVEPQRRASWGSDCLTRLVVTYCKVRFKPAKSGFMISIVTKSMHVHGHFICLVLLSITLPVWLSFS